MDATHKGAVVVGFDGSRRSRRAVDWAVREAQTRGHAVLVVHAVEPIVVPAPYGYPTMKIEDDTRVHTAEQELAQLVTDWRQAAPSLDISVRCEQQGAAQALADVVADVDADLVVLGAPEHGTLSRILLGSTADEVIRAVRNPVVVCGDHSGTRDGPVLIGQDDAEESRRTREFATEYAALHGARLEVVQDDSAHNLLTSSEQARLLVVAADRHTGIQHVLRGTAGHGALYQCHCPVALVHG